MVTLVVTKGQGSQDLYSQKLSQHIHYAPLFHTDIYQKAAESFNLPILSLKAAKVLWWDLKFVFMLNRINGPVHLPNQHLGRYGNFLRIPFIITVHDLIRYHDLNGHEGNALIHKPNLRDRLYLNLDYSGIKKAVRVIAVSHHTKKDLVKYLNIPEEKIAVIYEGVDHNIFKPTEGRPPIPQPYILFVGSEHPRKNLETLLKAFALLKKQEAFRDLKLLKVGKAGGGETDFRKYTLKVVHELGLESEVIFTDFVATEELPLYYSQAECFVFPSLYEGFGFPPLEAMACGCPVVVSNVTSLPEIVGDAAIQVEPLNAEALALAISSILRDAKLKCELRSKGLKRARRFSWERTAQETLNLYWEVEAELSRSRRLRWQLSHTGGR